MMHNETNALTGAVEVLSSIPALDTPGLANFGGGGCLGRKRLTRQEEQFIAKISSEPPHSAWDPSLFLLFWCFFCASVRMFSSVHSAVLC